MDEIQENLIDNYKNPKNNCILPDYTNTFKMANYSCGDEIEIFLKITGNRVELASFVGEGCSIAIATASMLTEHLVGKSVEYITTFTAEDLENLIGFRLSINRRKCALLSLQATKNSLK